MRLSFDMAVNKARGQTLEVGGVNLEVSCFSHGQFYVAISIVEPPKNLQNQTKIVVSTNVLN